MKTVTERDIEITYPNNVSCRKFDGPGHGLSHCMKAVDFILEYKDKILFIEIKDPDDKEYDAKEMMDSLKYKYRDSFLYEWASGRTQKPIHYYVLLEARGLDDALLLVIEDILNKNLPIKGPKSKPWKKELARTCHVFNIETWNKHVVDCRVARISEK